MYNANGEPATYWDFPDGSYIRYFGYWYACNMRYRTRTRHRTQKAALAAA